MERLNLRSSLMAGVICIIFGLSGCISIPNSPTPRFYALSSVDENTVSKKINIHPGLIIGVGPVKIPEYLDRPQIVIQTPAKMLQFSQFDRWGESLDLGLARLIREDISSMIPGAKLTLYPWNPSVAINYQVTIEVIQLNSTLNQDMYFEVQWMIIDVKNLKTVIIKRSVFHVAVIPQDYAGLAKTLSTACASLSDQIAKAIASIKIKKVAHLAKRA